MADSDNEWPYDDQGFPKRAEIDIDWLLKGDGFDSESSVFQDEDSIRDQLGLDFFEVDNKGRVIVPTRTHSCDCNPVAMYAAAQKLASHFSDNPRLFPRDLGSIEELRGMNHENSEWRRWIDPLKSWPLDNNGTGRISLWGCATAGHHCLVVRGASGEILVSGVSVGVLREDLGVTEPVAVASGSAPEGRDGITVLEVDPNEDEPDDLDLEDQINADDEETRYDERTYGDLDLSPEALPDEESNETDHEAEWREAAFPSTDVKLYLDAGLDLEHVQYLGRFMPPTEIGNWVDRFGSDSMLALELLRIGLGEITYNDEILELEDDRAPERIAEGIRMAMHGYLRRFRQSQEKKNPGGR